jgi:hypothetical protein
MIVVEINKPTRMQELRQKFGFQPPLPGVPSNSSTNERQVAGFWPKEQYNNWQKKVAADFPKGVWVTLKAWDAKAGSHPPCVWEVDSVEEVSFMAVIDADLQEPKALNLRGVDYGTIVRYCPCAIRRLTLEEIELARLRLKETNSVRPEGDAATEEGMEATPHPLDRGHTD